MGRPPLKVGTFGKIDFQCLTGPGAANRVRARANFRDLDGVRRQVTRWAPTKATAERALKAALRDSAAPGESDLTSDTRVSDLGARWLADVERQWPKSDAAWRRLALPPDVVTMIERRQDEERLSAPHGIVFGSPGGHLRDPNNTSGDLREILDGIDCEHCGGRGWLVGEDGASGRPKRVRCDAGRFSRVTSHVFRKTVATRLDEAGFSARQIADQLGHAHPSLTQDIYMGRKVVTAEAATLLDRSR